jgi:hypothetical protein
MLHCQAVGLKLQPIAQETVPRTATCGQLSVSHCMKLANTEVTTYLQGLALARLAWGHSQLDRQHHRGQAALHHTQVVAPCRPLLLVRFRQRMCDDKGCPVR